MFYLKLLTVFMNIILALVVGYFLSCQSWADEEDRASIIGFWVMIIVYALNVFILLVG